jgi:hypothetical protein
MRLNQALIESQSLVGVTMSAGVSPFGSGGGAAWTTFGATKAAIANQTSRAERWNAFIASLPEHLA